MMRTTFAILLATVALNTPLRAITFESGDTQAALVELFTSEGCSSCPPAEARLANLRGEPGLWKQFVPVAFHVDYWDRLGWPDRFASAAFTRRQYDYAAHWGSGSVYTPAFVQNGHEGSNSSPPAKPGRLRVDVDAGRQATVSFQPVNPPAGALIAEIAPMANGVTIDVRRGENAGRKLAHEFVALDLLHAKLEQHGDAWTATILLPSKLAAPISSLAAWVHPADDPAALQAVGGWLQR
jgi:hypothetical protein